MDTSHTYATSKAAPGEHFSRETLWPRALVLTIVAAFVARLAVYHLSDVMLGFPRPPNSPYAWEVGNIARSIALGKGFSSPLPVDTGATAWLTPVYPYLLAILFKIFGIYSRGSELGILYLNSAFSALTCWPIYHIARRTFGVSIGMFSARIWAFLPTAVFAPITWVWDTSLSALLFALIFWATLALTESSRARDWIAYGALWAFTVLTNPSLAVLLPFFLGWAAVRLRESAAPWLRLAMLSLLMFFVGIGPWTARNYLVFGRLIPFRSNLGLELYLGNNPYSGGRWTNMMHPHDNRDEREKFRSMGEIAYVDEKQALAKQFIKDHPELFARYTFQRVQETWTGGWAPLVNLMPYVDWEKQALFYLYLSRLFSLLAFVGLLMATRSRVPGAALMSSALLVYPMIYYVTHTMLRYRHPIDPIMAVLAAYALAHPAALLARRWKLSSSTRSAAFDQPTN
jgi:4-amino-4-deoxy-L-arabinose transferase-like glycosyltransferase